MIGGYDQTLAALQAEQAALQQRMQQLDQMRYNRPQYAQQYSPQPQPPAQNVSWIQVAGIDGAKNQIVQPGNTAWMMDNNAPYFYVKSVDGMGSATLKAFRFEEASPETLDVPKTQTQPQDYVTRSEFDALVNELRGQKEVKAE